MTDPVQAWAFLSSVFGGGWALIMFIMLFALPRHRFLKARVLLATFGVLGLVLAAVGLIGLS